MPVLRKAEMRERLVNIAVGNRVRIVDGSEAEGDSGTVYAIQANGIILVELGQGCIWPLMGEHEAERIQDG